MELKQLREFCIKNHRIMWNWLADNPDKNKKDWPGWEMDHSDLFSREGDNHCFLCGYVSKTPEEECFNCPLDWGVTETCINTDAEPASYFGLYCDAKTEKETSKYARIIANLPSKKMQTYNIKKEEI